MMKKKELDTKEAPSQHVILVGSAGSTKTSLIKKTEINHKIEQGEGGLR